jgi:Secretion system C-terminal sorting domain
MKKISFYLVFLLGILNVTHAQVVNWDTALSQIKTPTTGFSSQKILLDKVAAFANLYNYNSANYNTSDANHFKQSLSELYRCSDAVYFTSPENYIVFEKTIANATVIPIGIINTKCAYLIYDEENVNNGNLQLINNVFQPIRSTEPSFIEKDLCIISPLFPSFAAENNTFRFSFNLQQIYQYGSTIRYLEVDLGDGVWRTVIQNSVLVQGTHTLTLNVTGVVKQKISFRITQQSGTQITTYSEIVLSNKLQKPSTARNGSCAVSSLLKHRSTIADTQNIKGEIEYKVYYGDLNSSCKVKKPIIIVDGFDPGDKRRIDFEECKKDPKCTDGKPELREDTYLSLSKLMEYTVGTTKTSLIDKMTKENYDVILVNFPYYQKIQNDLNSGEICAGADDIIRNGYSIASFIQKINSDLVTNGSVEKLVVVGPSMGGLITKFALAYLEKQGIAHNTKLWVSMDSPHQGANIPLAIQQDIYFLGKKLRNADADSQFNDLLHSKAAEQLLLDIVDYDGNSVKNNINTNFLNTLKNNGVVNSNGFPVLGGIRKIAISNGSFGGVKNVNPKENFLDIRASVKIHFFGIRVGRKRIFTINNYYTPNLGESITLVDNKGRNPDQGVGDTNYSKEYTGYNSYGSMDAVPGGYANASNDLKIKVNSSLEGTDAFSNLLANKIIYVAPFLYSGSDLIIDRNIPPNKETTLTPQAFIPTHSALDTKGFSNWYQPIDKNLVCTGQTPFNSFYGESTNMQHITFTDNMVKWLLEELKGNPQVPSFPMKSDNLGGPLNVCLNTPSTYQFQFLKDCDLTNTPVWSVSPNLQIVNSTATSVTVKGLANGIGNIKATFQNGNYISSNMSIGDVSIEDGSSYTTTKVPFNSIIDQYGNYESGGNIVFNVDISSSSTLNPSSKFTFSNFKIGSLSYQINTQQITQKRFTFWIPKSLVSKLKCPLLEFTLTATSPCAKTKSTYGSISINCLSFLPDDFSRKGLRTVASNNFIYKIFPNPSSNIINISLFDETLKPSPQAQITAKLYDINGLEKRSISVTNNTATINVSSLPKGIYILKINIDGVIESHQVVVE